MARKALAIIAWALATAGAIGVAFAWLTATGPRGFFPPGAMTAGHHQIELACESCHAVAPFTASADATAALNDACRACHAEELERADDSHAGKRFRGPRMARFRRALDARQCTTCHVEHRPEITRPGAVTVAMNFCVACHGEGDQDIRASRPSHAGVAFDNCATAGCHNYHDNRALYEDFLLDHARQPWLLASPKRAVEAEPLPIPVAATPSAVAAAVAPASALTGREFGEWAASAHAQAQVHCAVCHAPTTDADAPPAIIEQAWTVAPDTAPCIACHEAQAETFARGRHGMRGHPLVAPARAAPGFLADACCGLDILGAWLADAPLPTTMTVAEARLPMRADAASATVNCVSCHGAHALNMEKAAADACAACHDDAHSRAYFESPHYDLWRRELAGAPAGTGVSCATCHMAQRQRRGKIETSHNQSALLRPVEKMIRPVCLRCHGLGFAIDSLADADLVAANFRGRPSAHVPSIDWALRNAGRSGGRAR